MDTIEPVEFDKKTWKTDPNAYARNYYKLQTQLIIKCSCGKQIKKSAINKHLKSKNHQFNLLELEIKQLKGLGEHL